MKIGIEVELHSNGYDYEYICRNEGLSFTEFNTVKGSSIGVKMSREYYGHTIEYNFTPFELSPENMIWLKEYLKGQMSKYSLHMNSTAPSFVGTHVHIFDEEFLSINKPRLLVGVLTFILSKIDRLSEASLQRLLLAHQLWGNWSWKNNKNWKKILNENGRQVNFHDASRDRPKNNPIIKSPSTQQGKPTSLEIRCIPNEFVFDNGLFEMLLKIRNGEIHRQSNIITALQFFKALGAKLFGEFNEIGTRDSIRELRNNSIHDNIYAMNMDGMVASVSSSDTLVSNSQRETIRRRLLEQSSENPFADYLTPPYFNDFFYNLSNPVINGVMELLVDGTPDRIRDEHPDCGDTFVLEEFQWLDTWNANNESAYALQLRNDLNHITRGAGNFHRPNFIAVHSDIGRSIYRIILGGSISDLHSNIRDCIDSGDSRKSIFRAIIVGNREIDCNTLHLIETYGQDSEAVQY